MPTLSVNAPIILPAASFIFPDLKTGLDTAYTAASDTIRYGQVQTLITALANQPPLNPGVLPNLLALSVSSSAGVVGNPIVSSITNATTGSALTLTGAGAAGLAINNGSITGTPTAAGPVNIVETLAGAPNSPRQTTAAITIATRALSGSLLVGQSQAVRQFGKMPDYVGTNASLGVAISPNAKVFARYTDDGRTLSTPTLGVPSDGGNFDSTFAAEYTRIMEERTGRPQLLAGHAVGATTISQWQPGQQYHNELIGVLNGMPVGFDRVIFHLGGTDAGANTSAAAYKAGLTGFFDSLGQYNKPANTPFQKIVITMATRLVGGAGNAASVQTIRKAAKEWCAANNAIYLEPHDVVLEATDPVHQGQVGGITLARSIARAALAGADNSPTLAATGTLNGTAINLKSSLPLTLVGDVKNRFAVFNAGTSASALAIASVSVNGVDITVNLSADPGTAQALDVYWLRHPDPSGSTAAANMLYDSYSADGLPAGRHLMATTGGPVAIPAPGGTPTPTPTPTPSNKMAQVNFRSTAATTTTNPSGWNAFDGAGEAPGSSAGQTSTTGVAKALLMPDGTATGWTLTTTQASQGAGTQVAASGVTYPYPDDVDLTYWFNGGSSVSPASSTVASTLHTISGLNPAKLYDLTFFGTRTTATARQTQYAAGGQTVTPSNTNNVTPSTLSGLAPNSSGVLTYTYTPAGTGQFGYINALIIKEQ